MYRELVKVITVSVNEIKNKISEIKKAFEIISNSFPINSDKFVEMFNDLTKCEIEYSVFIKPKAFVKLSKRFELRIYMVRDRVYCIENGVEKEYMIKARVTDIFDNYRTVSLVIDYKVFNIKQIK